MEPKLVVHGDGIWFPLVCQLLCAPFLFFGGGGRAWRSPAEDNAPKRLTTGNACVHGELKFTERQLQVFTSVLRVCHPFAGSTYCGCRASCSLCRAASPALCAAAPIDRQLLLPRVMPSRRWLWHLQAYPQSRAQGCTGARWEFGGHLATILLVVSASNTLEGPLGHSKHCCSGTAPCPGGFTTSRGYS